MQYNFCNVFCRYKKNIYKRIQGGESCLFWIRDHLYIYNCLHKYSNLYALHIKLFMLIQYTFVSVRSFTLAID